MYSYALGGVFYDRAAKNEGIKCREHTLHCWKGQPRETTTMRRWHGGSVLAAVALLLLLALRRWLIPAASISRQPAAKFRWRTSQFGRVADGFARPSVPCGARFLVAHEQHLQAVGSDVRLLWLLRQLRALDAEVSLLLRAATPAARRWAPHSAAGAARKTDMQESMSVLCSSALLLFFLRFGYA